jgi:hypothetical protein
VLWYISALFYPLSSPGFFFSYLSIFLGGRSI